MSDIAQLFNDGARHADGKINSGQHAPRPLYISVFLLFQGWLLITASASSLALTVSDQSVTFGFESATGNRKLILTLLDLVAESLFYVGS